MRLCVRLLGRSTLPLALGIFLFLFWRTSLRWPVLILAMGLVLLIGTSRVYLGVHYRSDILEGWAAKHGVGGRYAPAGAIAGTDTEGTGLGAVKKEST